MAEPITAAVAASAAASSVASSASAAAAASAGPSFFAAAFAFAAGLLLTWPALIVLLFVGILFEHNGARGWAVFTALAVAAVSYFFFSVSLLSIAIGAVCYIVIGLIWSFWRYKRHAQKVVEAKKNSSATDKEYALRALHPKAMLGTITAWIVIWPFSMVENLVGDIINFIQELVTKFFRGVYHRIYDSAVSALK